MPQPILFMLNPITRVRLSALGTAPLMPASLPLPTASFFITGTTKDSSGVALASCLLDLYRTSDDASMSRTISDGSGAYSFSVGQGQRYYIVAYKAGGPDVAGTTVNTLTGV